MIYRIFTGSSEHFLTGTPGLDIPRAFANFRAKLSPDAAERKAQLISALDYYAPGVEPSDDLLPQAFLACIQDTLDLRPREMTEVYLELL